MKRDWVSVDLDGLEKTLARRGKSIILGELLRNALDEDGVTEIKIETLKVVGAPRVRLKLTDDAPSGFRDLAETYTMFGESYKKGHPTKAGRFNVGDKLVLAFCEEALITSTTGSIKFDNLGRGRLKRKTERGSVIDLILRMNREEYNDLLKYASTLIIPDDVKVLLNEFPIPQPAKVTTLEGVELWTEIAGQEGVLKKVKRTTTVDVFTPLPGNPPMLYELGIPVMELEGKYHVSVNQKVPLTLERDAVPPSFLKAINVLLVNSLFEDLTKEEVTEDWVRDATSSKDVRIDALGHVLDLRFGEKRVSYDPSDPEANKMAVAQGYTVIHGGSLSKAEWDAARGDDLIVPAGQVTPSPKVFDAEGRPLKTVNRDNWTHSMEKFALLATRMAKHFFDKSITVRFTNDMAWGHLAAYGPQGTLYISLVRASHAFFEVGPSREQISLLLHEFTHEKVSDHLSSRFADTIADLGAQLVRLALDNPDYFETW